MGSSTRKKYSSKAKSILKEGNVNIQEGGRGLAYAMKDVLKNGNSTPRKKLKALSSSNEFKSATTRFYSILNTRKGELRGLSGKRYNIIINEIIEDSNFTSEYQRLALKQALRRTDFNSEVSVWKIIGDFFNLLLRFFFSEAVLEPVSDAISCELDDDVVESELDKIEEILDYTIDKEDEENITEEEVEEELVDFANRVKLAFGGNS